MESVSTSLVVLDRELFDFLWPKVARNFPSPPLDSVVWYRVYSLLVRRNSDGNALDWRSGAPSRGRRGNRAVLRARGLAGGAAAPCLWLSAVLAGGGQTHRLYQTRQRAWLFAQGDYRAVASA